MRGQHGPPRRPTLPDHAGRAGLVPAPQRAPATAASCRRAMPKTIPKASSTAPVSLTSPGGETKLMEVSPVSPRPCPPSRLKWQCPGCHCTATPGPRHPAADRRTLGGTLPSSPSSPPSSTYTSGSCSQLQPPVLHSHKRSATQTK